MKRLLAVSFCVFTMASPTLAPPARAAPDNKAGAGTAPTMSATDLRNGMRRLWVGHVMYTRNFIISALAGSPDVPAVTDRLLRNQDDIGGAIKPIYGDEAGKKLAALLRDHILIAAELVKVAKARDTKATDAAQTKWRKNADDIAGFLAAANPSWAKPTLTDMLYKHLDLTTAEVVARIHMDWKADIAAFDAGNDHMTMFADMLSDGIIKQHPNKVSQVSQR
jgi:hypothetical protein